MELSAVLQEVTFGKRIAEEESDELASYFVETEQWRRVFSGEVDVVYGSKGSGKSAIYSLLLAKQDAFFDRKVLLTAAENPRGATAFRDLVDDPPASENEFRALWKLYLLSLAGAQIKEFGFSTEPARQVMSALQEAGLLEGKNLSGRIRSVLDYVRRRLEVEAIEGKATAVPPSLGGKITFREPTQEQRKVGMVSADDLLDLGDQALRNGEMTLWILLDRLDVAFAENLLLEQNALRALFRVYGDLRGLKNLKLKIFLRDDIWKRITEQGYREASHITQTMTLEWDEKTLLNLMVRRVLGNKVLLEKYGLEPNDVLSDMSHQEHLFYRLFPSQVDAGSRKPATLDWMLSRTQDGTKKTAPRELIHLLESTKSRQLEMLEIGQDQPPDDALFAARVLKIALAEVSKVRLEQTIYAEYPDCKPWLLALEGAKTDHDPETLADIWHCDQTEAGARAQRLVDIGFFEPRGTRAEPRYWVPFLYRDALDLVQGAAD